jgi:hypothetical protein
MIMNSRFYGIAIAAVAAGFVAFGGTHLALAACKDDIAAVQAVVDKEQDPDKKQKAMEELKAAQTSAGAQDEVTCKAHVDKAREHVKK